MRTRRAAYVEGDPAYRGRRPRRRTVVEEDEVL